MAFESQPNQNPRLGRAGWLLIVWIIDGLIVLAIVAAFVRNPFEFASINYLYHLGQKKDWVQVIDRASKLPEGYRRSEKYSVIHLEALLHLSRNSDAIDYIRSQPILMAATNRRAVQFQQLAAFAFVLIGRERDAVTVFVRHSNNSLSGEMARLIQGANDGHAPDVGKMSRLKDLVADSMIYPDLYQAVVEYIAAQGHLRANENAGGALLLDEICDGFHYPYQFVFQRDLGIAQMELGRVDLSAIHLLVASRLLRQTALYRVSDAEIRDFQSEVFSRALKHMESRSAAEFWRLMRCLEEILSDHKVTASLRVNPHPLGITELWEWSRFGIEYDPVQWVSETSPTLPRQDESVLAVLDTITQKPPMKPVSLPIASADPLSSSSLLQVVPVPIHKKVAGLVRDGDTVVFTVPATTGSLQAAVVMARVRGSLREGLPGGCSVRVGMDQYYLSPTEKARWYAFALPVLSQKPVTVRFEFNSDSIAGYTEKGDKEDRNLYIHEILACYLKRR